MLLHINARIRHKISDYKLQLSHFEERYTSQQVDLVTSQEKQKLVLSELAVKEEELLLVKVELSSLQEKFKSSVEDVSVL